MPPTLGGDVPEGPWLDPVLTRRPVEYRNIADRVLEHAADLTTGQLRARIQRLCVEADHEQAKKRYEQRVEERRMISELTTDGTANLMGLDLPPHRVAAISGQIEAIARRLKQTGDTRTMDQLRADIFLDLLLGKNAGQKEWVV